MLCARWTSGTVYRTRSTRSHRVDSVAYGTGGNTSCRLCPDCSVCSSAGAAIRFTYRLAGLSAVWSLSAATVRMMPGRCVSCTGPKLPVTVTDAPAARSLSDCHSPLKATSRHLKPVMAASVLLVIVTLNTTVWPTGTGSPSTDSPAARSGG